MDAVGPAGGGVAEPAVLGQSDHDAVIRQEALLVAHQTITALADAKVRHDVRVKHVQELARIRPLDDDLAKGRGIQHAHIFAGIQDFAVDCLLVGLSPARIAIGAAPQADRLHIGAVGFVPAVDRAHPQGLENLAPAFACQRAQGHGRIGRAEGGGADIRDLVVQGPGQHGQTVDVRQFALIGRHAKRGVTLGVFDTGIAFAGGQLDVRHLHVVLVIQPHLRLQLNACALRHDPDGLHRGLCHGSGGRCLAAHLSADISQGVRGRQVTIGRTNRHHHGRPVVACRRAGGVGTEMRLRIVPRQLAAAMAPQVHHRRPAARHGDDIAGHLFQNSAFTSLKADGDAGHPLAALDLHNRTARFHANAHSLGLGGQIARHSAARVDNQRHFQPRLFQGNGGAVAVVIVGGDHCAVARGHSKVHHIIAHGRGQHHAGNIIAGKGQRPLNRARGGHDLARPDAPEPMLRPTVARGMVSHLFIGQHIAVVINARRHAAQTQRDIRHFFKGLNGVLHPYIRRCSVNHIAIHRRAATPMGGLLHQDDAVTRLPGDQRRLQARNTAAHDQQIAESIGLLIVIRVLTNRGFAEASRAADDRFEHMLPSKARVDEGLVIKARRQETRGIVIHNANIEFQAGKVVLACAGQPIEQLGRGGALVRFKPPALAHVDNRVRLFGAAGNNAARTVVFERPTHQHLVIGQKRGRQRVAGKARHALAVEGEMGGTGAVDQTTALGQTGAHL